MVIKKYNDRAIPVEKYSLGFYVAGFLSLCLALAIPAAMLGSVAMMNYKVSSIERSIESHTKILTEMDKNDS